MPQSHNVQAMRERIEELKRQINTAKKTGTVVGVASVLTAAVGSSIGATVGSVLGLGALGAFTVAASPLIAVFGAGVASYALAKKFSEERDLAEEIKRLETVLEKTRTG